MRALVLGSLALLAAAPAIATAGVSLGADCTAGQVTCGVSIFNDGHEWQGVVIQWRYGNQCGSPWAPIDMEPLPLPALFTDAQHTLTFPAPDPDQWIEYAAFGVDAEGGLHGVPGMGDPQPYDWDTCGDAVLSRGYLVGTPPFLELVPCPGTCWFWGQFVDAMAVDPATYAWMVGLPLAVDIRGEARIDGMPGGTMIVASSIELAPDHVCAPATSTEAVSWGALKSLYR